MLDSSRTCQKDDCTRCDGFMPVMRVELSRFYHDSALGETRFFAQTTVVRPPRLVFQDHGVTVKFAALAALPPEVVMATLPVLADAGTVAVICVSESTVSVVAGTPPKVTFVV